MNNASKKLLIFPVANYRQSNVRNIFYYIRSLDPAASCREYARYPFMNLLSAITEHSKSDEQLLKLLNMAYEYAEIYLLAKKRQKGCDGMGELTTIKEEFRDAVDKVIKYCKEKDYPSGDSLYDIDSAAKELSGQVKE